MKIALEILILALLSGCAPLYVPNTVNTPLLTEQNEVQVAALGGSGGLDIQTAYAITDEIGVMGNLSIADQADTTRSRYHKHNFKELGIGYMTPMSRTGVFEIFAGYGWGTANSRDSFSFFGPQKVAAEGDYHRFFIQPSAGTRRENMHLALTTRLAWVTFTRLKTGTTVETKDFKRFFVEPVVTFRLGFEYFKIQTQLGLSIPLAKETPFESQPFILSVGLFLNFNHSDGAVD